MKILSVNILFKDNIINNYFNKKIYIMVVILLTLHLLIFVNINILYTYCLAT